ncbi:MAG: hypothetical protein N2Z70_05975 [Bdellovibrionaceae bacterium]|nr:hypothetical protein [Pseudobdellovibrionaceae bacterium]
MRLTRKVIFAVSMLGLTISVLPFQNCANSSFWVESSESLAGIDPQEVKNPDPRTGDPSQPSQPSSPWDDNNAGAPQAPNAPPSPTAPTLPTPEGTPPSFPPLQPSLPPSGSNPNPNPSPTLPPPTPSLSTGQMIVATIYSEFDHRSGANTCLTAKEAAAQAVGYFDLGSYGYCDNQNIPLCRDSQKLVLSQISLFDSRGQLQKTTYHTVCVRQDSSQNKAGFNIVATMRSSHDLATGKNDCKTAKELPPDLGYFDLGNYSYCNSSQIPMCQNGSHKVIFSGYHDKQSNQIIYYSGCVTNGPAKTKIVGTIYSESDGSTNQCLTVHNSQTARSVGYWDLNAYTSCHSSGIPRCVAGSYRVITGSVTMSGNKTKFHSWCVLPNQNEGSSFVATMASHESFQGQHSCQTVATTPRLIALGYFDSGNFSTCDSNQIPLCHSSTRKVLLSSSDQGSGINYSVACVQP